MVVEMTVTRPSPIYIYVTVSIVMLQLTIVKHVAVGLAMTRPRSIYFDVTVCINRNPTRHCLDGCDKAKSYML